MLSPKKYKEEFKKVFFPGLFCANCLESSDLNDYGFCRNCFSETVLIRNGKDKDTFHVFKYEGPVSEIIHSLKYQGKKRYGKKLAKMVSVFLKTERFPQFDFIVPVPLYWKKEFIRGFNQSALISVYLGRYVNKRVLLNFLVKNRNTLSQTKLGKKERKNNVLNSFRCSKRGTRRKIIKDSTILLFDDVYTTGATVAEAKKALLKSGASKVLILTVAKAEF